MTAKRFTENFFLKPIILLFSLLLLPIFGFASESPEQMIVLTNHPIGFFSIAIFVVAYMLVMAEEYTHLRKSKPVIIAAGILWGVIAFYYSDTNSSDLVENAFRHNLLDYAELFLFLLVAMTYVNALEERLLFDSLRIWLVKKGFTYRQMFWLTGWLAFFISPVADNMTTALIMCAVLMAVGAGNARFISLGCINVVVAANAGGAFSPFGDITTLMVWQKGILDFWSFFLLFIPAVVNYVVPAIIMHFAVPSAVPPVSQEPYNMKRGAIVILLLFIATIVTAVSAHSFLHLPPVLGMMTGLGYLQIYGYYLRMSHRNNNYSDEKANEMIGDVVPFDVFHRIARAEWDTLLFFYGVVMCVGALGFLGYLALTSQVLYVDWGATNANIAIGALSAIVDNIPLMFAVLSMNPDMSAGQWLLITLTTGVGGSMLSIGSAAGVALMGQARGFYTFVSHLKWSPVIALGYAASIWVHFLINQQTFQLTVQ